MAAGILLAAADRHGIRTFVEANTAGRVYAAQSWVEFDSWSLAPLLCRSAPGHQIVDLSVKDGQPYLQKAPGLSWLAVPVYGAVHWLIGAHVPYHSTATVLALVVVLLPIVLMGLVLLRVWTRWFGSKPPPGAVLALLLASPMALYSATFQDYPLAAMLLITGWTLGRQDTRRVQWAGGLMVGLAGAVNYAFFIYGALLGAIELVRRFREAPQGHGPRNSLSWLGIAGLGAGLPLLAIGAYHTIMWGSPFTTAYAFMSDQGQIALHAGIHFEWATLARLLVGGKHGLLIHTPWAVAGIAGLVIMARSSSQRWLGIAGLAMVVTNLGFASVWNTTNDDTLAFARHTVPLLPWLALGLAGALSALGRQQQLIGALLRGAIGGAVFIGLAYQITVMWTFPYHAEIIPSPIWQVNLPLLIEGLHIMPIWTSLSSAYAPPGGASETVWVALSFAGAATLLFFGLYSGPRPRAQRLAALFAAILTSVVLMGWGAATSPVSQADRAWAKGLDREAIGRLSDTERQTFERVVLDRRAYRAAAIDVAESRRLKADLLWRERPYKTDRDPAWCHHLP